MRLWHYKLIEYLPNSQLLAQWRELNSIFKKQDKHILINYIYEYPKKDLYYYSQLVIYEMEKRNINIKNFDNYCDYFEDYEGKYYIIQESDFIPFKNHHNHRYLLQCFYNLQEKYDRGQKDFSFDRYGNMEMFVENEVNNK